MESTAQILAVAEVYCAATGLSLARVATLVHNHGAFFKRLSEGADCTTGTFRKCMQWFSDRWPDGAKWPATVDRPAPRGRAAA